MGRMVRQREFICDDSSDHRAGPHPGAKTIGHGTRLQDVSQLLALARRHSCWAPGAVSFEDTLQPINLPPFQPQTNIGAMNFENIGDLGSAASLHIESHCVKPVGHPIGTVPQGLFAELHQILDFLGRSTDMYCSHATSFCQWHVT